MLKKVKEAITEDHEELGEATYDLQRAFEMFLQTDYFKEKVNNLNTTSTSLVNRLLLQVLVMMKIKSWSWTFC